MGEILDQMIAEESTGQTGQGLQQAGQQASQTTHQTAEQIDQAASVGEDAHTLGDVLGPVLSWERNNVEFWVQLGQLVVLLLILREVRTD